MEQPIIKKKLKIKKPILIAIIVIIFIIISIILFLIFKPSSKYKISFDVNGGKNLSPLTITKNGKLEKPDDPTKEGYEFVGWYYKGKIFDFDTKVTHDLVLEAKWKKIDSEEETSNEENVPITGLTLNTKAVTLSPYESTQLKANIEPLNATSKDLEWTSSNEKVAIADVTGKVKALKEGTTTITVKTKDGEFEDSCTITVVKVKITGLTIKGTSTIIVGGSTKLIVDVSPKNAVLDNITWSSSNPSIATIDSKGNVKGIKEGSVVITAKSASGATATYKVTVTSAVATNPTTPNTTPTPPPPTTVTPTPPVTTNPEPPTPTDPEPDDSSPDPDTPDDETQDNETSNNDETKDEDSEKETDPKTPEESEQQDNKNGEEN